MKYEKRIAPKYNTRHPSNGVFFLQPKHLAHASRWKPSPQTNSSFQMKVENHRWSRIRGLPVGGNYDETKTPPDTSTHANRGLPCLLYLLFRLLFQFILHAERNFVIRVRPSTPAVSAFGRANAGGGGRLSRRSRDERQGSEPIKSDK